jgi:hypothetical protein
MTVFFRSKIFIKVEKKNRKLNRIPNKTLNVFIGFKVDKIFFFIFFEELKNLFFQN